MKNIVEAQAGILRSLGLEKLNVERVVIDMEEGSWPTVAVVLHIKPDSAEDLGVRLKRFKLVAIEDEE